MRPTIKTIDVNETQDHYVYKITLEKVEFAENETRVYINVENSGSDEFSIYSFNGVISQNGNQYEEQSNYNADYPEMNNSLLVGNKTEGIIAFPALEDAPFTFTIDAYSNN